MEHARWVRLLVGWVAWSSKKRCGFKISRTAAFSTSEKEGVVDRNAPVFQASDGSLVGRCISCREVGDMHSNAVARIIAFQLFFPLLDAVDPSREVTKEAVYRGFSRWATSWSWNAARPLEDQSQGGETRCRWFSPR